MDRDEQVEIVEQPALPITEATGVEHHPARDMSAGFTATWSRS